MSAYFVAQITITDPDAYERYLAGFDDIFARYQGTVVAVDDHPVVLEGKWACTRVVLMRFPGEAELRAWYDSPEYQALAEFRRAASQADILLVHGRE